MSRWKNMIYTIGHSSQSLDEFLGLLRRHDITKLVDVRSAPYSRFTPQFNREALQRALDAENITYVFLGKELGARSDDLSCYENGRVQYRRLARTAQFQRGLRKVIEAASQNNTAMMCAEKEPLECHRSILIGHALHEQGADVVHILADGSLEPHGATMFRLLDLVGLPRDDLFQSEQELIDEALKRQEERIAFVNEELAAEPRRAAE